MEFTPELLAKAKEAVRAGAWKIRPIVDIHGKEYYVMMFTEFSKIDFELSAKEKYKLAAHKERYFRRYGKHEAEFKGQIGSFSGFSIIKASRLKFYLNPVNLWYEFKRILRKLVNTLR